MDHRDCSHLLDGLTDYTDGEASTALCAELERHLAECGDCRVVVDTLRQTIRLYHTLPRPAFPSGVRQRLYRSLELGQFLRPDST